MNKKVIHLNWTSYGVYERNNCYMFWNDSSDRFPFILPKDSIEAITEHSDSTEFVFSADVFNELEYSSDVIELYGGWFNKLRQSSKCISIKRK